MFGLAAGLYDSYFGTPQLNVLLLGQSGTGKTALLERIKVTRFQSNVKPNVQARIVPNTPPVTPILTKRVAVLNRSASHPSPVLNPPSLPPTGLPQDNGQSSTTTIPKDVGTETSTENAPSPVRLSFRQRLACPAPKRYANNMEADQDEEEYVSVPPVTDKEKAEEEEEEETTEKSLETTPAAAATVGKTNETATTTQPQGTTATQQAQEEEEDVEEYDVRPGQKMLPLHKIRPTNGQNLAKVLVCGAKCHIFDVSGSFQGLWERYYNDCDAVIFCWKLDDGSTDTNGPDNHSFSTTTVADNDDMSSSLLLQQQQQEEQLKTLETVRAEIADDVPFLIWGHSFDASSNNTIDLPSSTLEFLPNYTSNMMRVYCGSAKTGGGVRDAMEWLIPLAKRQAKLRAKDRMEQMMTATATTASLRRSHSIGGGVGGTNSVSRSNPSTPVKR